MIRVFRSISTGFICICLMAALTGCLPGNGEGYSRKPGFDTQEPAPDGSTNGNLSATALYYLLDPSYFCVHPETGESIPSYRNSIQVYGTTAYLKGDRCRSEMTAIDFAEIQFSASLQFLAYREGIYIYLEGDVTESTLATVRAVEGWCQPVDVPASTISDIVLRSPRDISEPWYAQLHLSNSTQFETQASVNDIYLPVTRETNATARHYFSTGVFDLNVSLTPIDDKYPGELSLSGGAPQSVWCRLQN